MLLAITMVFNILFTPGEVLVRIWKITITHEGVAMACRMSVRLIFLMIGSSLMTLTTTPNQLTDALESLLGPLKKIHVPVHEISMMMSIALRFIPILLEETDKIMKAQMARGAVLRAEIYPESKEHGACFWYRCLFQHSAVQMIWRWRWKHAATTEEREEHR